MSDASVLRQSLIAMARAVSNAEGEDKLRIEEECRSLHKQGVGRWMGCASFCRIFKVLRTDPNGDIVLGMTQTRCPCIVILASVPVVSRWMVRNQDLRFSLTSLRTYVICVRVLSDKRTYVPTHAHSHSEYRMFAGTSRSRRRRRTTTRWLRCSRPCRRPLPDGPNRSTTRRRCGSQERCEPAVVMSRIVQARTYVRYARFRGGGQRSYVRRSHGTDRALVLIVRARSLYVRTYLSQSCAGSHERVRTYVRTEERSSATWCAGSATGAPSCARRAAPTSFGSW